MSIIGMSSEIPVKAELHFPLAPEFVLKPIPKRFGHPIRSDLTPMCNWQKARAEKSSPTPILHDENALQMKT
ncbi:hypothetical protein HED52_04740 [Ochrobactrum ciceri]|uniref:Uncharacterized protein n=1 Tax=Brucella ciceri TaxID=391287 RepID=A0ABX1DTQ4_9HYPH|nr:hypothetical protein [Brucella ciceri]